MGRDDVEPGVMRRRQFLRGGVAAGASLAAAGDSCSWGLFRPAYSLGAGGDRPVLGWRESLLDRPRYLKLVRPTTGEAVNAMYWAPGSGYDREAYAQICWLMRDVRAGRAHNMDPRLLDLLCGIQYWLAFYGYRPTMQLLSGLRTRETNDRTEGAAKHSLHIEGMAADIRIPGISTATLGTMSQAFGVGGTGFYLDRGFVHVDTGRVRSW